MTRSNKWIQLISPGERANKAPPPAHPPLGNRADKAPPPANPPGGDRANKAPLSTQL